MRAEWDDLSTHEQARRLGRAGGPALGVRLEVDADGEVIAQSNHNLDGYWEQPEETARAQAGNWFHTGDGGRIDDEGYLVIADRKKDVIITGGENVSSIEVEDALTSHPAVREVAVIGIPDEKWGELVTALVVTDGSDVTAEDLISALPRAAGRLQVPEEDRVRRRTAADGDRASCRSSSCASSTGPDSSARSTERPSIGAAAITGRAD